MRKWSQMVENTWVDFFLFVYNNFPADTASKFHQMLENQEIEVLSWPVYSPSLNPIKHCWDMLDQAVNLREVQSTNLKELKVALSK